MLKTLTTCYGSNGSPPPSRTNCAAPSTIPSLPITETDVYTSLGTSSYNEIQTKFDATYGNVTYAAAYDFGASTPTTQVLNVYGQSYSSPTACTAYPSGTYINNTHCYSHTENSSGTDLAKTKIAYSSTGHPTSVSRWVSGSTWLTSSAGFNNNGSLAWSKDAAGNQTTYAYDGSCNSMVPTSITYPLSSVGSSSQTWDCNGGVVTASTDANNRQTTYTYNDPLWRMTNVAYPDGGHEATGYSTGTTFPWKIETVVGLDSSRNMALWRTLDGLGRTVQTENDSDPGGTNYVQTVYNSLGQVYSVTNPFFTTTDQTYGLTYYTYDALGRITQIQHPSGKKETFTFNNRATKHVLYPSNNAFTKVYQSDGLGRLTDICEVTSVTQANGQAPASCGLDISGTGFHATNSYDPLGNVLSMNYSSVRSFIYDGLSRITSATYPESGTITYVYDSGSAGDLYQRTAPAPNQTGTAKVTATYSYDALHRLTGISYSDGTTPTVVYNYDQSSVWSHTLTNPKGRLTSAGFPGDLTVVFGYDSMGRVVLHGQCTPLNCGTTNFFANYSYNYLGEPSGGGDYLGIAWTNTYNAVGQLQEVDTNWLSPTQSGTIVSGIVYNALGEPTSDSLGDGKTETSSYNVDGHQTAFSGGASPGYNNTTTWLGDFITSSTDNVNGNWTYTYDDFARLSSAVGSQTFNYSYDQHANRWGTISGVNQFTFDGATNHITSGGITYDAAGNVTYDGFHTYTYDGENRLKQVDSGNSPKYNYDAFGNRNMQYAPPVYNEYVLDLGGRAITAIAPGTSTVYTAEVNAGGRHWVTDNGSALFLGADWAGTSRALTNLSGTFDQLYTSLPWGDGLSFAGNGSSFHTTSQFTGKEYDPESNLYHFPARQYAPVQGRWLTPDPSGLAAVDPTNPQSWNRYVYVANNPVSFTDPTGLMTINPNWYMGLAGSAGNCSMDGVGTPCEVLNATFQGGGISAAAWCSGGSCNQIQQDPESGQWQQLTGWQFRTQLNDDGTTQDTLEPVWQDYDPAMFASAADVQHIQNIFNAALNRMNQSGRRRPGKGLINGLLNDLEYWGTGYQACTGQSYTMCDSLNAAARTLDDNWTFTVQSNFWHTWVSGTSPNPADPSLTIDPLYGTFTVNYPTTP